MKGKLIPAKDERGNIVVDPTTLVTKDPFFIDYHLYNKFKKMVQEGQVQKVKVFSKEEKAQIRRLFGHHEPVCNAEPTVTELQKYTTKKAITRKILG